MERDPPSLESPKQGREAVMIREGWERAGDQASPPACVLSGVDLRALEGKGEKWELP